jgi:hypothetical protein
MSDEELEKFEVTDYDLENEFNINRPNRRISKNKQIYGKCLHRYGFLHLRVGFTSCVLIDKYLKEVLFCENAVGVLYY